MNVEHHMLDWSVVTQADISSPSCESLQEKDVKAHTSLI